MNTFKIDIDCPSCANKIESEILKLNEVKTCNINFMLQKINIEFNENVDFTQVIKKICKVCKEVDDDAKIYF